MSSKFKQPMNKLLINNVLRVGGVTAPTNISTFPYYLRDGGGNHSAKIRPILVSGSTSTTLVMKGRFHKRLVGSKKPILCEAFDNRKYTVRQQ